MAKFLKKIQKQVRRDINQLSRIDGSIKIARKSTEYIEGLYRKPAVKKVVNPIVTGVVTVINPIAGAAVGAAVTVEDARLNKSKARADEDRIKAEDAAYYAELDQLNALYASRRDMAANNPGFLRIDEKNEYDRRAEIVGQLDPRSPFRAPNATPGRVAAKTVSAVGASATGASCNANASDGYFNDVAGITVISLIVCAILARKIYGR